MENEIKDNAEGTTVVEAVGQASTAQGDRGRRIAAAMSEAILKFSAEHGWDDPDAMRAAQLEARERVKQEIIDEDAARVADENERVKDEEAAHAAENRS